MLGLSVANVVGVPAATWLGQTPRLALGVLGGRACSALVTVAPGPGAGPAPRPADRTATGRRSCARCKNPQVLLTLLVGAVGFGGMFAMYSYIAPTVTEVDRPARVGDPAVPARLRARQGRRHLARRPARRLVGAPRRWSSARSAMGARRWRSFTVTSRYAVPACSRVFAVAVLGSVLVVNLQMRLMQVAGDAQTLGAAMNHASLNIANALGAWLGGARDRRRASATRAPSWVGAGLSFAGLLVLGRLGAACTGATCARRRPWRRRPRSPRAACRSTRRRPGCRRAAAAPLRSRPDPGEPVRLDDVPRRGVVLGGVDQDPPQAEAALLDRREAVPDDEGAGLGHRPAAPGLGVRRGSRSPPPVRASGRTARCSPDCRSVSGSATAQLTPGAVGQPLAAAEQVVLGVRPGVRRGHLTQPVRRALVGAGLDDPVGVLGPERAAAPRRSPASRGTCSQVVRGARSSSACSAPDPGVVQLAALGQPPLDGPVAAEAEPPGRPPGRPVAPVGPPDHGRAARARSKPQSSSSPRARCTIPRPRAHGCAPYAISARRVALVAQLDRAAEPRRRRRRRGPRPRTPSDPSRPARRDDLPRRTASASLARCRAPAPSSTAGSAGRRTARGPRRRPRLVWRAASTTPSVSTGTSSGSSRADSVAVIGHPVERACPPANPCRRRMDEATDHERHAREHRACRRLRPHRRRVRRRRDRAGVAAGQPGPRAAPRAAAAGGSSPSSTRTPTGSSPRCRSASRWPGFLSAAFGGATLSGDLAPKLVGPRDCPRARPTSSRWSLVTIAISYVSLVIGELAPEAARACSAPRRSRWRSAPTVDRIATIVPPGHLAAVDVDQPRRAAARRRPERAARADVRRGAARARRRARDARRGGAPDRRGRLRGRRPADPRGDDPAHRGRLPRRRRRRSTRPPRRRCTSRTRATR